eukprot:7695952-Alexandrium_andersonii.AAC.1
MDVCAPVQTRTQHCMATKTHKHAFLFRIQGASAASSQGERKRVPAEHREPNGPCGRVDLAPPHHI